MRGTSAGASASARCDRPLTSVAAAAAAVSSAQIMMLRGGCDTIVHELSLAGAAMAQTERRVASECPSAKQPSRSPPRCYPLRTRSQKGSISPRPRFRSRASDRGRKDGLLFS